MVQSFKSKVGESFAETTARIGTSMHLMSMPCAEKWGLSQLHALPGAEKQSRIGLSVQLFHFYSICCYKGVTKDRETLALRFGKGRDILLPEHLSLSFPSKDLRKVCLCAHTLSI